VEQRQQSNQQWLITPTDSGGTRNSLAKQRLALQVAGGASTNGAIVDQREYSGAAQQQWFFSVPASFRRTGRGRGAEYRRQLDGILSNYRYVHVVNANPGVHLLNLIVNGILLAWAP